MKDEFLDIKIVFVGLIMITVIFIGGVSYHGVKKVKAKEKILSTYIGKQYSGLKIVGFEYPNKLLLNNGEWIDYRIVGK